MQAAEKVKDMVTLQLSIYWHQNPYHKLKNIVSLFISLDFLGLVILPTHLLSKSFSSHLCPASMWQLVPCAQCRTSHSVCFPASNDQSPAVLSFEDFFWSGKLEFFVEILQGGSRAIVINGVLEALSMALQMGNWGYNPQKAEL